MNGGGLPPGFGDPNQWTDPSGAGVIPQLLALAQSQPFVGADFNTLAGQESFTDTQAQQAFQNAQGRLGIQRGALGRESAALPQEHSLANQLLGLSGQDLGIQRQQLGIQGKSLDITQQQEQQQADIANRGQWSSGTARGATNTSGFRSGLGDISNNLANQMAQLGLSRQGLGLQGQGLDIQGQRLGIEQQQSDLNYGLQQGSLADQLAGLNISGTEIGQQLQNSIGGAAVNRLTGALNVGQGAISNAATGMGGVGPGIGATPLSGPPPNSSPISSPTPLLPGRT